MPILESLDSIDWASLSHAFGSADDVPQLLRQRASANSEEAEEAEGDLFGNIWHQGTVYEATAFAVPFLVELITHQETHRREGLVVLLASIAKGSSFLEVHKDLPHYSAQDQAGIEAELNRELKWKADARDAVQRFAASYWDLMDDPSLRICVPYLLSTLPEEAGRVRDRFPESIYAASDSLFLASLLLGLAIASGVAPEAFAPFTPLIHSEAPMVRLAAGLGVLMTCSSTTPPVDHALCLYFDALRDYKTNTSTDQRWLWGLGDTSSLLLESIPLFSPSANTAMRDTLVVELPKLDEWAATSLAATVMHLGFDQAHLPRRKEELNPLQRSLLNALARSTNVRYLDPLICGIQSALGLSREIRDLKAFMEPG